LIFEAVIFGLIIAETIFKIFLSNFFTNIIGAIMIEKIQLMKSVSYFLGVIIASKN